MYFDINRNKSPFNKVGTLWAEECIIHNMAQSALFIKVQCDNDVGRKIHTVKLHGTQIEYDCLSIVLFLY